MKLLPKVSFTVCNSSLSRFWDDVSLSIERLLYEDFDYIISTNLANSSSISLIKEISLISISITFGKFIILW